MIHKMADLHIRLTRQFPPKMLKRDGAYCSGGSNCVISAYSTEFSAVVVVGFRLNVAKPAIARRQPITQGYGPESYPSEIQGFRSFRFVRDLVGNNEIS
jgi:hypothetical protein